MQVISQSGPTKAIKNASRSQLHNQKNLWKGVYSVILGAGPAHALHFATYEYFKEIFSHTAILHNSAVSDQLIASGTAGAIATLAHDSLMTPFDGKL